LVESFGEGIDLQLRRDRADAVGEIVVTRAKEGQLYRLRGRLETISQSGQVKT
jgi:hypothetical protein